MRKLALVLIVGLLGLSLPFAGKAAAIMHGAITKDEALAKLSAFNKNFRGMHASLEVTTVTVLVDARDTSTGEIFYAKKGNGSRIRIDIKSPSPQITVLDGNTATIYMPKLAQAQQFTIGSEQDKAETSLLQLPGLGSSADINATYDVTLAAEEVLDGKNTAILDLKPKTSHHFSNIRLWVDEQRGNPLQIQFTEPSKDYTIYKFTNPDFGQQSDSKFDIGGIVPKNVHIQKIGG